MHSASGSWARSEKVMYNLIKQRLCDLGIVGAVQYNSIESRTPVIKVRKSVGKTDLSKLGAVAQPGKSEKLSVAVELPRCAGLCDVRMCISADGKDSVRYELEYTSDYVTDVFRLELAVSELPDELSNGLYYYHFELDFGVITLYTNSVNNSDFELTEQYPETRFRLLVYDRQFRTPEWFKGNIMYHIFVDRFNKGSKKMPVSPTAVMEHDWENGIPQYGEYPGAFVENNVFFGGTLCGIREKLEYLHKLGVGCIYLSPIFKAYSNHKYDTGDYMTVDEMFGGDAALSELIAEAEKYGIKIILDGVFNHTGDDSLYFNRYGRYDSVGAYQSEASQYRDWYTFEADGKYKSWWGIEVLPKLNLKNTECREYFLGKDGVLEKYLDMGIGGIRLDVADELPTEFLHELRKVVRSKNKEGLIIGEVWENAADKIAYDERRDYFRGKSLDSVMNYPMKNAVIEFVKNGDARFFHNVITELYASYPVQCSDVLMNILGTHDTDRILTVLAGDSPDGYTNAQLSVKRMTKEQRALGIKRLYVAAALQYTLFGTPSVFYGDEVGMEGYRDPFCRMPYPWHDIENELLDYYRKLGDIRRSEKLFAGGDFGFCDVSDGFVCYRRYDNKDEILILANTGSADVIYPLTGRYNDLLSGNKEEQQLRLSPMTVKILKKENKKGDRK